MVTSGESEAGRSRIGIWGYKIQTTMNKIKYTRTYCVAQGI